jgi:hypothetical protein
MNFSLCWLLCVASNLRTSEHIVLEFKKIICTFCVIRRYSTRILLGENSAQSYTTLVCHYYTRWRSWLRHCAASRKLAGWISDGVIGTFH